MNNSKLLYTRAQESIPGGVNSPVRAFNNVGGNPIFIKSAKGAYLWDEDNNKYIDYINSWGPMILGHAYDPVIKAVGDRVKMSTSFGAPTQLEIEMAELIKQMVPNIDLIRMVSSGTEACMSAVRLARGYTGRNKIIKFEGCYHGHADCFLVNAGSGVATLNLKNVAGITPAVLQDTLTAVYNDLDSVQRLIKEYPGAIAAIIIEPVAGNMGCVLPKKGFLEGLREICDREGIVFILDEVMTGFRLARGGAQEKLGIEADLLTYGKIIGGGMPVGAFGGKKEIMQHIAPIGSVYQAGTLSGNPIAMIAGYTLLNDLMLNPAIYTDLENKGKFLAKEIGNILTQKGIHHQVNQLGSMLSVFFTETPVVNFETASQTNLKLFRKFFHHMLNEGIYLPPSAYETWFISHSLSEQDIDKTLNAVQSFRTI